MLLWLYPRTFNHIDPELNQHASYHHRVYIWATVSLYNIVITTIPKHTSIILNIQMEIKIWQTNLKPVCPRHVHTGIHRNQFLQNSRFNSHCGLKDCCRRKWVLFSGGSERKGLGRRKESIWELCSSLRPCWQLWEGKWLPFFTSFLLLSFSLTQFHICFLPSGVVLLKKASSCDMHYIMGWIILIVYVHSH